MPDFDLYGREIRHAAHLRRPQKGSPIQALEKWSRDLAQALQIPDLHIDHEMLELARRSADTITDAAAPVTAFLVGYAAGSRGPGGSDSIAAAVGVAIDLCDSIGQCEPGE
ncbi:DUF6457 domain-containing protein [Arthrobacter sp. M4]|uniref:DUF6457 domain-containing protein n=1 Tax=Arthrobacter sp. M4 TaxID=218160 RepID=UPI001CDBA220|nr:DUF6457 domain-containing protein [Arthrobacter sp. M4]MCA4131848.1 DUF6457 domain-containing protein [Arthrobacter sp. M4]